MIHNLLSSNEITEILNNPIVITNKDKLSEQQKQKMRDRIVSDETREKISAAARNRPPEVKENMRQATLRRSDLHATLEKMRAAASTDDARMKRAEKMRGRVLSEEHRKKISLSLAGRYVRPAELAERDRRIINALLQGQSAVSIASAEGIAIQTVYDAKYRFSRNAKEEAARQAGINA